MGKDKKTKTKKKVESSSSSSDSDTPPPKKVDKKKAKKEIEKKKAEPVKEVKKDKKSKSKKKVESSSSSDSDSSDAKPVKKRSRAASNVSAASKGSGNKAQKKNEKAVVPQKKSKVESSSESSSDEKPAPKKTAKKAESSGSDSSSDEIEEAIVAAKVAAKVMAKVQAKVETPAAVIDEHDGKLELFVQNLSPGSLEEDIRAYFEPYGELSKCKLLMSMGQSKGKAFIEYKDHNHARVAMNSTNDRDFDGRILRVEWTFSVAGGEPDGETKSIFVGNLGFRTEAWALEELFKSCGTVTNCTIGLGQDGRPRGYAHVDFDSNASALEALKLVGTEVEGRPIRIDLSKKRGDGGGRGGRGGFRGGDRGGGRGGGVNPRRPTRGFGNNGGDAYGPPRPFG